MSIAPGVEQTLLAVYSAPTGCNRHSGRPASIQLINQIVRGLCLGFICLSKGSVCVYLCVALENLASGCFIITMFSIGTDFFSNNNMFKQSSCIMAYMMITVVDKF